MDPFITHRIKQPNLSKNEVLKFNCPYIIFSSSKCFVVSAFDAQTYTYVPYTVYACIDFNGIAAKAKTDQSKKNEKKTSYKQFEKLIFYLISTCVARVCVLFFMRIQL